MAKHSQLGAETKTKKKLRAKRASGLPSGVLGETRSRSDVPSELAKQIAASLDATNRSRRKKGRFLSAVKNTALTILGKRSREEAALDFAENHRRVSKRTQRRRQMAIYGGGGLLAVALLLIFVLGGGQAPGSNLTASAVQAVQMDSRETVGSSAGPTPVASVTSEAHAVVTPLQVTTQPTTQTTLAPTIEPTAEATPIVTTPPEPTPPPVVLEDCIDDFIVEADVYYDDMGFSSNYYNYTEDEKYLLAQIIDIESRGEPYKGMVAVGNVVMNRVLNRRQFDNNITDVVTSGEFAYKGHENRKPGPAAKSAARDVLDYELWVVPQDIYFFHSGLAPGAAWSNHTYYDRIKGHNFYSHHYSGRNDNGEIPWPLFERTYKYARYGCKPEKRVIRIQKMLVALGFKVGTDGYFGKDTMEAIKLFQDTHGLEADGVAGPATIEALITEFGLVNYYEEFLTE